MAAKLDATPKPQGPAQIGDNSRAIEEAERVQLISIVNRVMKAEEAIEAARVPFDAARKERSKLIGLGKAAGFSAKEITARIAEMVQTPRDMAESAAREARHRKWLGILTPEQAAMFGDDKTPVEIKDEAHWKGEGYKAGLRQLVAKPPPECGERFVQAWMGEHERGLKEVTLANVPGAARLKPSVVGDPAEVGAKAAADFAEDNPEALAAQTPRTAIKAKQQAEVPDPEEVDKAARALKKKEGFLN